jgi:hypothetical protein
VRRIDILVPPPGGAYRDMVAAPFAAYRDLLAEGGWAAEARPWSDGPGDAPALALLAWGYHHDLASWDTLIAGWPADLPLLNDPALLAWNTRKTYLAILEAAGVPTVPTVFGPSQLAAEAFDRFGVDELVVKPQVSAGSDRTARLRRGETPIAIADAMIQPFLGSVGREGEYSLFFFGGAFSHAIRKVAAAGDFRVQPQFGAIIGQWTPDVEAMDVAQAAQAAAPAAAVYARVDLVRRDDGRLALIEYEAIEPDLYLQHGGRGALLVDAITREVRRRG